jgi:FixJ family two-component response regulator
VLARRYLLSMVIQAKAKLVAVVDDDELMRNAVQGLLRQLDIRHECSHRPRSS